MSRLALASTSPRRRELLGRLRVDFEVIDVDVDETQEPGELPLTYVTRLAEAKSRAAEVTGDAIVLTADTTIDLDGEILGKPRDERDAVAMLERLAGRLHRVHTGVAVRRDGAVDVEVVTTEVEMAPADQDRIRWYISTGEPLAAAGAYQIQQAGDVLVSRVTGSVSNVIGLPLATVMTMLERAGAAPHRDGEEPSR